MKIAKNTIITIAIIFSLIYALNLEYFVKGVRVVYLNGYTTVYIDDYKYFDNEIVNTSNPKDWILHTNYNNYKENPSFEEFNSEMETSAFLIIKNDSLLVEKYYDGYDDSSMTNSFSMSKTILSLILGKAIEDGFIKDLNQKVIEFIPELKGKFAKDVRIIDLAQMSSGLKWNEATFNPFSVIAKTYFVDDLNKLILDQPFEKTPGKKFNYSSGNTQFLSIVIERATGKKITKYFSENFWQKMNAQNDALWQLDSYESGNVKAFCCFISTAKDISRIGKLYLNNGDWNGTRLINSSFIENSIKAKVSDIYGIGTWLTNYKGLDIAMMRGHLGQYVIIIPEKKLIITRTGKKYMDNGAIEITEDSFIYIDEALRIVDN